MTRGKCLRLLFGSAILGLTNLGFATHVSAMDYDCDEGEPCTEENQCGKDDHPERCMCFPNPIGGPHCIEL